MHSNKVRTPATQPGDASPMAVRGPHLLAGMSLLQGFDDRETSLRLTLAAIGDGRESTPAYLHLCNLYPVRCRAVPTKRQTLREKGTQSHGTLRVSRVAESVVAVEQTDRRRHLAAPKSRQERAFSEDDGSASCASGDTRDVVRHSGFSRQYGRGIFGYQIRGGRAGRSVDHAGSAAVPDDFCTRTGRCTVGHQHLGSARDDHYPAYNHTDDGPPDDGPPDDGPDCASSNPRRSSAFGVRMCGSSCLSSRTRQPGVHR